MQKTSTVQVDIVVRDTHLSKTVRYKKKYHVHDPKDEAKVGDLIEFYEGIPVSKTKFMHLSRVVDSSKVFSAELEGK